MNRTSQPIWTNQTVLLISILLLAFALRMVRIGELRMWGDEAFSVYVANRGLEAITFSGAENDPHPPLYYFLLHFYMPLAGTSELALRLFSVIPGLATVAVIYGISKRLYRRRVGIAAAAIAAVAPFAVLYSQEIRMYALAILLSALGTYFLIRLLQSPSSKVRLLWIGYALVMLLGLYTLYHTAFTLLAHGVLVLWHLRRQQGAFFWRWVALGCGLVLAFVPWLLMRFSSTLGHLGDRAGTSIEALPIFLARGFAWLTVGATVPPGVALWPAATFAGVIILSLIAALARRRLSARDGWLLILVAVPLLAVYPLYLLLPILIARLFALSFVPLTILLARSLSLFDRRLALPLVVALGGFTLYSLQDYYVRYDRYKPAAEDYMPLIQTVQQGAHANDVVLFHAFWQVGYFLSHYHGPPLEYRALGDTRDLEYAVAQPRQVWAVVQDLSLHGSEVWLAQQAYPMGEKKYGQIRVALFLAGTPGESQRFAPPLEFNNGIRLLGSWLNDEPLTPGKDRITVRIDWQATTPVNANYTVSLRLTNPDGSPRGPLVWSQDDSPPASGTLPTSHWQPDATIQDRRTLEIPLGTPPGDYAVRLVMYDAASGAAASVVAPENRRGQEIYLGEIRIARPAADSPVEPATSQFDARWGEVALAGFHLGDDESKPGDLLPLTLHWQARTQPKQDYMGFVQVVDAAGNLHSPQFFRLGNESFTTDLWQPHEVWLDKLLLKIDADTAPGPATILVGLIDSPVTEISASGGAARWRNVKLQVPASGKWDTLPAVELAQIQLTGREHYFDLPNPAHADQADWDGKIKLLGYNLDRSTFKPGDPVRLVLFWQAQRAMDERYAIFVHLVNAAGDLVAQSDGEPQSGSAPTTGWLRGEVLEDEHLITLPQDLPAGEYVLNVGLYQPVTGIRLPITGASSDYLRMARIQVRP